MSSWKPEGYPSISAYLISNDPEGLIAFVKKAFDGKLLRRFDRLREMLDEMKAQRDEWQQQAERLALPAPTTAVQGGCGLFGLFWRAS